MSLKKNKHITGKMKKFLAIIFITSIAVSCNKELKINADWKDVSVIYGVLEKRADTNYVRIHRGYLGNEGITGGNQNPDSLYYLSPEVKIEIVKNNAVINTVQLTRDESHSLDSGFFTTKDYHTYRFDQSIDEDAEYRLVVDKTEDGLNNVYAITPIVKDFLISEPRPFRRLAFAPNRQNIKWNYADNGRMYQVSLRMHYLEMNRANHKDTILKYVDFTVTTRTGSNLDGNGSFTAVVDYDSYYRFLITAIGVNRNVIRFHRGTDLVVVAVADDLATYMNVSAPSNTVVQDKPHFTNIMGGDNANAGIFSSSNRIEQNKMKMSNPSLDSLVYGILTCDLQFGRKNALDTCYCKDNIFPTCD